MLPLLSVTLYPARQNGKKHFGNVSVPISLEKDGYLICCADNVSDCTL